MSKHVMTNTAFLVYVSLLSFAAGLSQSAGAAPYTSIGTEWKLRGSEFQTTLQSALPNHQWSTDSFQVNWNAAEQSLRITSVRAGGHELWANTPHRAFVVAGRGRETISQRRGSFNILDKAEGERCFRQTLDLFVEDADGLHIEGRLSGDGCSLRYHLDFKQQSAQRLAFGVQLFDENGQPIDEKQINRTALIYASQADEHFYGFGEQFSQLDMKGRLLPIFGQEQGHLRGALWPATPIMNAVSPGAAGSWHTTYTAIPFYLTNKQRGLFLEQSEYLYFDMQAKNSVEARVWASGIRGQIVQGNSPLDIIEGFTEFTGRMPMLPDWFHSGAIVGIMGGESFVRQIRQALAERRTPIAGFWLQDWVGKRKTSLGTRMWWNWELDTVAYPNWDQLTADLRAEGIRVLGYINPFLSDVSEKASWQRNLFVEARDKGYLVQKADGGPYEIGSGGFSGTLVDLSNPQARSWLKTYLKAELFKRGFSGWMADFGEALPLDAQLASGVSASRFHNEYLNAWSRLNREIVEEAGKLGEAVFFVRNAGLTSAGTATMFWLGDQMTSWDGNDGLKSSITGLLSGGISGLALNHSDIGGLIAFKPARIKRDSELLQRWSEMNAFTSAFRTHEGNEPSASHQFYSDKESLDHFAYFAKVFAALFPYRKTLMVEASSRGYPVVRHPWLHYPADATAQALRYQFMLGADFMVAPVTESGAKSVRLYLPAGDWVQLWTGKQQHLNTGVWMEGAAPIGFPAVYFRAESQAAWQAFKTIQAIPRP